jgi:cytochrome b subunit of formate dehydrogenase
LARQVQRTTVVRPPHWWFVVAGIIVILVGVGLVVSGAARPTLLLSALAVAMSVGAASSGWWLRRWRIRQARQAERRNRANVT